ncbi:unnamed protein product [Symbiodinium sp. CCMP2592]|nr:unnamed protein product [Symbiodinium sp. CCMP2592]
MPEQLVQQAELQSQLLQERAADDDLDLVEVPEFKVAGIVVPDGFEGERRSFTANIPERDSKATISWYEPSVYVKRSQGLKEPYIKIDRKGGSTLGVRKYGGWAATWKLAIQCARGL